MMHGPEKSDLVIVAVKPANKANEPTVEASAEANAAEPVERRAGAKGNTHQQSTHWTQHQARVSQELERIRQLVPSHTRGRSRMRDTYGSGRGARGETRAPTATTARVHHVSRRRGCMAAGGSCAAAVYTGDRIFQPQPQLRRHQPVHA